MVEAAGIEPASLVIWAASLKVPQAGAFRSFGSALIWFGLRGKMAATLVSNVRYLDERLHYNAAGAVKEKHTTRPLNGRKRGRFEATLQLESTTKPLKPRAIEREVLRGA